MNEGMTKTKFLEVMRSEHERWEALLGKVDEGEMARSGAVGHWSVRDTIVHVTAYERGLVEWLEAARRGEVKRFTGLDHPDVDYRNAVILKEGRGRSLELSITHILGLAFLHQVLAPYFGVVALDGTPDLRVSRHVGNR
jgi:hypothetical protein